MLYEIHMLKNYPSTNLNRDDSGAPKTCTFGGVTRARISSQCLKRSWRTSPLFKELVGAKNLGIRTRELPELVETILLQRGYEEKQIAPWMKKLTGIANKEGKENADGDRTAQVIFYAPEDVEAVANVVERLMQSEEPKNVKAKEIAAAVAKEDVNIRPISLDIALFGRMVTSDAFRDVEAAMQVAHAVSTHRVMLESDYFTAMDDLLTGDSMESSGSSMIGDTDYNSACYYIYAAIDADALRENLRYGEAPDVLVAKAIPALLQAMAFSNPSGKQNSFAGHVLPSAVLVECKERKIPVSYVNAYVEPARATGTEDLVKNSLTKLVEECNMTTRAFELPVQKRLWFCLEKYAVQAPAQAEICQSFSQLLDAVQETLK